MPTKAKVFLVDDDKVMREGMRDCLPLEGHQVVLEAGSLEEALEKTKEALQKGVNLAIIDGSLKSGANLAEDGEMVASALRQEVPGIKIIGLSGLEINFGDINLKKPVSFKDLAEMIEKI